MEKPSTIPKPHLLWQGNKEASCHGSTTYIFLTNNGPVNRIITGDGPRYVTASFQIPQGDRPNTPQGKRREDDGGIRRL